MLNYKNGYVIAEVAQGYEGRLDYSKLFVKAASKSNANAIKFQVIFSDNNAQKIMFIMNYLSHLK